jgi:hypothetical protein
MTKRWRKTLLKAVDVYFVLKPVCEIWDNSQHDPLGIFISLLLSRYEPWRLRYTHPVVDLAPSLQEVLDTDFVKKGHLLCKFLYWTRPFETLPEGMVPRLLHPIEEGGASLLNSRSPSRARAQTQPTQHHHLTSQISVQPLQWHMWSQPWQTTHPFQSDNYAMKGILSLLQMTMSLFSTKLANKFSKEREIWTQDCGASTCAKRFNTLER